LLECAESELISYRGYSQSNNPRIPQHPKAPKKLPQTKEMPPDKRFEALTKIISCQLNRDDEVRNFRQEVLGNKLLSDKEFAKWLIEQVNMEQPTETISLDITGGGGWQERFLAEASSFVEAQTVGKEYPHERKRTTISYRLPSNVSARNWVQRTISINKKGTLSRLKKASEKITGYGFWTEAQSIYFILTGIAHPISPARVTAKFSHFNTIILEVFPHVPGVMVEKLYQEARKMFMGKTKEITEKHLALAVFAAEQYGSWNMKMKSWNKKYPDWKYPDTARSTFARDCRVAYERVTGWDWDEDKKSGR